MNLLNEAIDSRFVKNETSPLINQKASCTVRNETIYNTEVLKSNFCNYEDTYILVKVNITVVGNNESRVAFGNFSPFTKWPQELMEQQ